MKLGANWKCERKRREQNTLNRITLARNKSIVQKKIITRNDVQFAIQIGRYLFPFHWCAPERKSKERATNERKSKERGHAVGMLHRNPWNKLKCKHILWLTLAPILHFSLRLFDWGWRKERSKPKTLACRTQPYIRPNPIDAKRLQPKTKSFSLQECAAIYQPESAFATDAKWTGSKFQIRIQQPNTLVRAIFFLSNGCETPFKDAI